jgi:KaiC/GvpD/RAD55 family RecA-like ATPase
MAKQELYERSPIRIFDEAAGGGLKAGELGLVTAKKGLGKTSVLVQFGMDTLLNGKQLVHVSFNQHSENVISWYDGIYNEISKKKAIANAGDVKEQVLRNRTILNFNQDNISLEKVVNTLNALKAGGTAVAGVVIDDVDFEKVKESDIQTVASYAKATKTKIWISATSSGDDLEDSAPKSILPYFSAVVHLAAENSVTKLNILKIGKKTDVESNLKLDSKTLLITNK